MTQSNASTAAVKATQASHKELSNAIRALSMDAVERANSGHPGMPMGMADVATVLFSEFLNFDPKHPEWPNRDRFVLSAGHGSMLLYSLLYLTGYEDMSLEDIKNFRQLGSKTAGHPEFGHASGIETTTGPLGQGIANAVGMALAERLANARYGDVITNHYTYAIAGDGCLMEGISHEAASLAGHLKLNKLIVLWDDNNITIDGAVELSSSDDVKARFEAYQWQVLSCDGHDENAIREALKGAQGSDQPVLIACKTTIGYGAPNKAGTSGSHGSPLGEEEIKLTREALDWPHAPFEIPEHILGAWRGIGARGGIRYANWVKGYDAADANLRQTFENALTGELGSAWQPALDKLKADVMAANGKEATRKSSQNVLEVLNEHIPQMIGGSADLTGSNNTKTSNLEVITPMPGHTKEPPPAGGGTQGGGSETAQVPPPRPPRQRGGDSNGIAYENSYAGRYVYYGIREHGMAAVMNGLALYGGFIPYGGTFLVFTDYCRPSIRLSALMQQRVIYVMTHDSIGLGEDGPTHQPIEHLTSLRAIPNLNVFRPADAVETAECWALALTSPKTPSILALSRQNLPNVSTAERKGNPCAMGGYVIFPSPHGRGVRGEGQSPADTRPHPRGASERRALPDGEGVTLIATGSEVSLAIEAAKLLEEDGIAARVVSMPCAELFDAQPASYQQEVLGDGLRVSIEAAATYGWQKYTGLSGLNIGIDSFGASGPAPDVYKHFGLTPEAVAVRIKNKLAS